MIVPKNPLKVAYQPVINKIPKLLASENPNYDIILHIGLAAARNYYTLEQQSVRDGYLDKDVDDAYFSKHDAARLFSECPAVLRPTFDCADVLKRWRGNVSDCVGADIRSSNDPGSYLCGFLYYLSLSWFWKQGREERPVVFLHVPDLPNEIDIEQGRRVAIGLIRALVESRNKVGVHDPLKELAQNANEAGIFVGGATGKEEGRWDGIQ
jgi:pyrrolidone-carboxylate peptidase